MSIITDGLLIATCLTAALYCIVLSRRLARFSDTESGIGKQISQLNTILEETRASTKESQSGAKSVSDRLSRDLSGARKASKDLAALMERAEAVLDRALELQDSDFTRPTRNQDATEAIASETDMPKDVEEERLASELPVEHTSPIEEQAHDDLAERDFDLADARGEPQLGFLPSVSDTSAVPDVALEEDVTEENMQDDSVAEDAENLLKVERMAL